MSALARLAPLLLLAAALPGCAFADWGEWSCVAGGEARDDQPRLTREAARRIDADLPDMLERAAAGTPASVRLLGSDGPALARFAVQDATPLEGHAYVLVYEGATLSCNLSVP